MDLRCLDVAGIGKLLLSTEFLLNLLRMYIGRGCLLLQAFYHNHELYMPKLIDVLAAHH